MPSSRIGNAVLALLIAATYIYVRSHHQPPAIRGVEAPDTTFSAERAFEHVLHIASEPHPAGSEAADKVRDYIFSEIERLGLEPFVQEQVIYRRPLTMASVHNVLARIEGHSGRHDAVALMAHYDSVTFGPGAADDGAGVAALLEAMRALAVGPKPLNDIIFLFTDGEEGRRLGTAGLLGAHAFVEHHPWVGDVRVVLNFDARGVKGPSYIYQTSGKDRWLISQLSGSRSRAAATSLMSAVYESMPVGSDLTAFANAGIPGYDCAFIDGLEKYHTRLDSPEYLSLASLQHHGEYAFGLAGHLANQPLGGAAEADEDVVYFDVPGNRVVYYSQGMAIVLTLMVMALYAGLMYYGIRRGTILPIPCLKAFLYFLAWMAVCLGLGALAMVLGYRMRGVYILYSSAPFTGALMLWCAAATVLFFNRLTARLGSNSVVAALMLPWVILAVLSTVLIPGASYLFAWPLLFALVPAGVMLTGRLIPTGPITFLNAILLAVCAAPALFFMIGTIQGFYAALLFIFIPLHLALLLLALAILLPQIQALAGKSGRAVAATLLAVGFIPFLSGIFWPGFTAEQPKFNSVTYALDADTDRAYYLSCDETPDAWTARFFPSDTPKETITTFIPVAEKAYLKADAPVVPLPPPTMELQEERLEGGRRVMVFTVHSPRGAEVIEIYAEPGTSVLAATVNDQVMDITDETAWRVTYSIYRGDGITLTMELPMDSPASFRVADHKYFLDDMPGFEPRPPEYIPKPNTVHYNRDPLKSEESIVVKTYAFPGEPDA